jgi:predicted 2-oxoglutarate/Fe(II)-dependent dioxygenase YbiX
MAAGLPNDTDLPFPVLIDADGEVSSRYGASRLRVVLLHPNARVHRYYEPSDVAQIPNQVFDDVERIIKLESPRVVLQQAPILLIPSVLPPDFCRRLIEVWETQGNADSGFMVDSGDKTVGKFDYSAKIRRDHFITRKSEIDETARAWVARHIIGEIAKSFNYEVTRLEDMKIACYDAARGGYFRPHRDNTTGATAHRRFAVSMLLNDDYEGGYLRFPEYGPHLYRPPAGGAVVFGCSLLHEATDVTAGKRFVLLTFLYGEKEAKIREDYAKRTNTGYRAGG